jgi:hypothetical protein
VDSSQHRVQSPQFVESNCVTVQCSLVRPEDRAKMRLPLHVSLTFTIGGVVLQTIIIARRARYWGLESCTT